jgi:intracellular sulfur oxidation DsrE/DsrF family protein
VKVVACKTTMANQKITEDDIRPWAMSAGVSS